MEEAHKKILWKEERDITTVGGSTALIIPAQLADKWDVQLGTKVIISLEKGKHGEFLAIWKV